MLPLKIRAVLVSDVTLCMLIFVMQVIFERRTDGSPLVLWENDVVQAIDGGKSVKISTHGNIVVQVGE